MRYFLISYRIENKQAFQYGQLLITSINFPSYKSICEKIPIENSFIFIVNIFEFKNKKDFINYIS